MGCCRKGTVEKISGVGGGCPKKLGLNRKGPAEKFRDKPPRNCFKKTTAKV